MTDDQKKIEQLQTELDKLSQQLHSFRKEINQLKTGFHTESPGEETGSSFIPPQKNRDWEFPSEKQRSSSGLENYIGVKLLHLAGIIVLVIGISIAVKYAVNKNLISPLVRVTLAYVAGLILYSLSVRLKKKYFIFSAVLFSGSMASLYFTTYAAFTYYQLIASGFAFALMMVITIFTVYSALRYNRQEIAVLGMVGAYGIPFLTSANTDRADLFFGYIVLINTGIAFLSYRKNWKAMTGLALFISWILFTGWELTRYETANQPQAIILMIIFYLQFIIVSVGFAIGQKRMLEMTELVYFLFNSIFSFISALIIFTDQYDGNMSVVTGIAGVVFLLQALSVKILFAQEKLLFNYLFAFSILCFVFYAGMRWDGLKVTMSWLTIAVILFVAGLIARISWLRLLSVMLTAVALGKLIFIDRKIFTTGEKIVSYLSIGTWLLMLSYFYQKYRQVLTRNS